VSVEEQNLHDGPHIPVLLKEVISALSPHDGGHYCDGTFGAGGYTKAMLEAADCAVLAIDRDPDAVIKGQSLVNSYAPRLSLVEGRFGDLEDIIGERTEDGVDGIALDIGVSSMQIDQAERGFSFRFDGPLDMRMEQSGPSAADVVAQAEEGLLADILFRYGEERDARRIARAIVRARDEAPIDTTAKLAALIAQAMGPKARAMKIDPATRSFQGLRIYVNDELGELARALLGAERALKPGGILAVVSFHSLEDRMVKKFLTACAKPGQGGSRHAPEFVAPEPSFELLSRKAIEAGDEEIKLNPRARSARLRAARRTHAPAIAPSFDAMGYVPLEGGRA